MFQYSFVDNYTKDDAFYFQALSDAYRGMAQMWEQRYWSLWTHVYFGKGF